MNIAEFVENNVALHGLAVIAVFGDQNNPPFAYTIGLAQRGQPDLLIIGVGQEAAHFFLNEVARRMQAGESFPDCEPIAELANLPCALRDIPTAAAIERHAIQANYYYADKGITDYRFRQLVISDRAGLLPWEDGYDHAYMDPRQACLWRQAH
ncbi:DUF4262 domain-containing protein [Chitinilyticum aquatile]|uniref:DUF4262 domain-containing protein n=1 Tax=Chitinilyticum aquatile TaxID=362520 RepID=UPI00040CB77C|nr:DUF4262 domain-containing protein [Chitinilyticum aquatile]